MKNEEQDENQFRLVSPAFRDDCPMPPQYSCKGQNVNPPLMIMNVPDEAHSLALIMHDPDAVNGDFTHWLVWDIPTKTNMISVNSVPVGAIQGPNGSGSNKYMGPCPPAGTGTHHYIFELYALDKSLGLPAETDRQQLEKALADCTVAKAVLTGLFAG